MMRVGTIALAAGAMLTFAGAARAQMTPAIDRDITVALDGSRALNGFSTRCVSYLLTAETPIYLDVDVREVHGGQCHGDPGTAPRMMTLRYDKRSARVYKRDDATGDFTLLR